LLNWLKKPKIISENHKKVPEKLQRLFWVKKVKTKEKYYSRSKPQIYNVRNKITPSKQQRSIIPIQNHRDIISKPQRSIILVQNRKEILFSFKTRII
jgi:hypothetical protein